MAALLEGREPRPARRGEPTGRRPRAACRPAGRRQDGSSTSRTARSSTLAPGRASFDGDGPARASTRSTRPDGPRSFAVNLDPAESKTSPLHVETLEQFGCRLASRRREGGRPRAAPAVAERGAGRPPEALAVADPGGDRRPDRRNLAGGPARAAPDRPARRPWRHEQRTAAGAGTGRAPVPARPALGRPGGLLAGLGRRRRRAVRRCRRPATAAARPGRWPLRRRPPAADRPRLRGPGASGRRATRAGSPAGSRRSTPSSAPACSPRSRKTRPPRAGSGSCRPPSSARPSNTAGRTTGTRPSPTWTLPRRAGGPRGGARRLLVVAGRAWSARPARDAAGGVAAIGRRGGASDVEVEPGDTEIERGRHAPGRRPVQRRRPGRREPRRRRRRRGRGPPRPMTRSLEDPTFAGRVESVDADLSTASSSPAGRSETYRVTRLRVPRAPADRRQARLPRLHVARAEDRRGHPPRHGRRGDRADPALPAQQGRRRRPGWSTRRAQAIALTPHDDGRPHVYRATFTLADPQRYKVQLVDHEGRPNKLPVRDRGERHAEPPAGRRR